MMEFTIFLPPITKKNSSRIIRCGNRTMLIPSKQYVQYEKDCKIFMPKCEPIDRPVNIKASYYMPTRRRVDKTNLESALLDILVKYNIISDDNCTIVVSTDGSQVYYDKANPRTEIIVTGTIGSFPKTKEK